MPQKVDYQKLRPQFELNERADFRFQERRHEHWTENYQLYRDKVIINRLTQRQSINVPLIKGMVKTVIANVDQLDDVEFEENGNDKDKQIAFNELWKDWVVKDKIETKDTVSTKQVLIYGLTWEKFNIKNGRLSLELREPFDVLVDRNVDPTDLETADHIEEVNIFRTLDEIASNPLYDGNAVKNLQTWFANTNNLQRNQQLVPTLIDKNQRLTEMGVPDLNNPFLGTTLVELKTFYQKIWDQRDQEFYIHVVITAGPTKEILFAQPLKDMMGINFYNLSTWGDDIERNDIYSDGVADIGRTTNKLLNSMISSLAENRVLRNMGMQYYDATKNENWSPSGFEPTPFGWYPLPGAPKDLVQRVDIPDMSEAIDEMEYVKKLVEAATAATSTMQGDTQQGNKVTLGEVELTVQAAKERMGTLAKFKLLAAKERADKWQKLMNANGDKLEDVKLFKKSAKGNYFGQTIKPSMWKSNDGYSTRVVSSAEREKKSTENINKLNAVKAQFPNNPILDKIYKKKLLEFGEINPDDVQAVMEYEDQIQKQMMGQPGMQPGMPPGAPQPGQAPAAGPAEPNPLDQMLQTQAQQLTAMQ